MQTLDLHGIRHDDVDRLVENFILLNETPLKIIIGNSMKMKDIVISVLTRHDFTFHYENFHNTGSLIVE